MASWVVVNDSLIMVDFIIRLMLDLEVVHDLLEFDLEQADSCQGPIPIGEGLGGLAVFDAAVEQLQRLVREVESA